MNVDTINARIAEMDQQLKQLVEQANLQAARISGGIEALKALLPQPDWGEDEQE